MIHMFTTTPDTAHMLLALKRKHNFYFRTLLKTDETDLVTCEVTEPGYDFIKANNINVTFD